MLKILVLRVSYIHIYIDVHLEIYILVIGKNKTLCVVISIMRTLSEYAFALYTNSDKDSTCIALSVRGGE